VARLGAVHRRQHRRLGLGPDPRLNGFGRIFGGEGGGNGASFGGVAGMWRMFNTQVGGQIAWLLPLAAVGLVAGLWAVRRAPRTDLRRAALILFGVWAVVHVVVFSTQQGIFHPYYVSALAPAVAALSGAGLVALWRLARDSWAWLGALQLTIAGTAWLAVTLLARTPDFAPALRVVIPVAAAVAVLGLVALRVPGRFPRRALAVAAVAAAIALAAGPAAYSAANVGRALNGNNVIAGPASASQGGFGGGGMGGGGRPSGGAPPSGGGTRPTGGGGMGGGQVSSELVSYLKAHQGSARYLVAATGSQTTAPIILQTGAAVITIGGFTGSDPAPTASQLAKLVADGELSYVLIGSQGGGPGGGSSSSDVSAWVKAHGTAVKSVSTSGMTLYRVAA
jgi:4-amino-4-deoxy-L-arabinose transferase-like glycosyltransferase